MMGKSVLRSLGTVGLVVLASCGGGSGTGTTSNSSGGSGTGATTTAAGGGGTSTSAVVDKYVGTWVGPCSSTGTSTAEIEMLALQKVTDTSMNATDTQNNYNSLNCSGGPVTTKTNTSAGTWVGSKTIASGETVDEINVVQNGQTQKQIIVIKADGKLYTGLQAPDGTVDTNGYPNTLDPKGMTKQ